MANILVAGGAGYLRSILVPELHKKTQSKLTDNLMFNQKSLASVYAEVSESFLF